MSKLHVYSFRKYKIDYDDEKFLEIYLKNSIQEFVGKVHKLLKKKIDLEIVREIKNLGNELVINNCNSFEYCIKEPDLEKEIEEIKKEGIFEYEFIEEELIDEPRCPEDINCENMS